METFFLRLAVAVIPLALLVTLVIVLDSRTRKSFYFLCQGKAGVTPFYAPSSRPPRCAGSRRQNSRQTTEDV